MADRRGANRPAGDRTLFVSRPEGLTAVPSPVPEVLDLAWIASGQRFLLAGPQGIHLVDARSGWSTTVWEAGTSRIRAARHGAGGQLLAVVDPPKERADAGSSLYAYDPRRSKGRLHEPKARVGIPFFAPGAPVRALLTVGDDLWEFTWPETGDGEARLDVRPGASTEGWFEGLSQVTPWWYAEAGWRAGQVRLESVGLAYWGVGQEGFLTVSEKGAWQVTAPGGNILRIGTIDVGSLALLRFLEGEPWVVLQSGDVRRLQDERPLFRARLPR